MALLQPLPAFCIQIDMITRPQRRAFPNSTPTLIDLLRGTLKHLEDDLSLHPDDPALREVKSAILLATADLQLNHQRAA